MTLHSIPKLVVHCHQMQKMRILHQRTKKGNNTKNPQKDSFTRWKNNTRIHPANNTSRPVKKKRKREREFVGIFRTIFTVDVLVPCSIISLLFVARFLFGRYYSDVQYLDHLTKNR